MKKSGLFSCYHAHTRYCYHANNTALEMVDFAYKFGYQKTGISEHCCYPTLNPVKNHLAFKNLWKFLADMDEAKQKYHGKIKVFCGFETEFLVDYLPWYKLLKNLPQVDYLIIGNHNYKTMDDSQYYGRCTKNKEMLQNYTKQICGAMKTSLFSLVAHPDLFMMSYPQWDENTKKAAIEICKVASVTKTPLGFNVNGLNNQAFNNYDFFSLHDMQLYPHIEFWKIASSFQCQVMIEVDAHNGNLYQSQAITLAKKICTQLKLNLVNDLKLK